MNASVPRVSAMTASKSRTDQALEKEWQRKKKELQDVNSKYGFGSPESKAAWKRFIKSSRTT